MSKKAYYQFFHPEFNNMVFASKKEAVIFLWEEKQSHDDDYFKKEFGDIVRVEMTKEEFERLGEI